MDNETTKHQKSVGKDIFKRVLAQYGKGWQYLSREQQRGAVALESLSAVYANQDSQSAGAANHVACLVRFAMSHVDGD